MTAMDKLLEAVNEFDHLTVAEAAEKLGRTENAVRTLVNRNDVLSDRLHGRVFIPRSEIDRLLLRAEHKAEFERLAQPGAKL